MSATTLVRPATVRTARRLVTPARSAASATPAMPMDPALATARAARRPRPGDERRAGAHVFRTLGRGLVCEYEPD